MTYLTTLLSLKPVKEGFMNNAETILKKYWGHDAFRPLQREIIDSVCAGTDTLALLPTGGGKSITYQIPAMMKEGICVVITPLISLMKDQVDALKSKGIKALSVHSGMSNQQIDATLDNAVYGNYKFLYVSPERTATRIFRERFARMNVCLIAIDEAHCISQWGYDFRPSYLRLAELRPLQPGVSIIAVTASATEIVCTDILSKLQLKDPAVFKKSFARENLSYIVRHTEDRDQHLLKVVESISGPGIVYVRLRKDCERLAAFLNGEGISAAAYHGGMSYEMRTSVQEEWLREKKRIIVATNAFGMGIDKPNVRIVVHYSAPESIESYYQEAGRAGRDRNSAYAVLLHDKTAKSFCLRNIEAQYPPIEKIKEIYDKIHIYLQLAPGEGKGESFDFDVYDFCVKYHQFSSTVIYAIKILEMNDYLILTEPIQNPSRVMFTITREEMYDIQIRNQNLNGFIQTLMRLYSGIFSGFVKIDESYISKVTGYSLEYIGECFKALGKLRILKFIPKKKTPVLFLNEERLSPENIRIAPESYVVRRDFARKRMEAMFSLIEGNEKCRSRIVQEYFGEQETEDCGRCDICRSKVKNKTPQQIIQNLLKDAPLEIQQIVSRSGIERKKVEKIVSENISEGNLTLENGFFLRLISDLK